MHKKRFAALLCFYVDIFTFRRPEYAHIIIVIIATSMLFLENSTTQEIFINSLILTFILLILAFDGLYFVIPDFYLLCLFLLSLIEQALILEANFLVSIGAGILGFVGSWLIARTYERLRNRRGLGLGDVKFFGLAGFMTSYSGLNAVVMIATLSAFLSVLITWRHNGDELTGDFALPFGCHIALGIWVTRALSTLA